ncbi:MAG: ABC transporter permease [Actinobacteria bacterium]|nr:ABC transporter permease [Actinomycetota bacterium]
MNGVDDRTGQVRPVGRTSAGIGRVSGPARFLQSARILAWRNVHNFFTNPALLLPAILFPLFFFTAFAGGLSRVQHVPGFNYPNGYTTFQFGFVLVQAAAFGGVFAGFSIARDFESGFSRRVMLATPHRSSMILGYSVAAMVRAVVVVTLLFVVGLASGMNVSSGPADLVLIVLLAMAMNMLAVLFASGIAFRFRTIQAGPLMQTPMFMALFLTPVYVPYELLSGWVKTVAGVNPLTKVVEASRYLLAGMTDEVAIAFGLCLVVGLVLFGWSLSGLRNAERSGG